MTRQWLHDTISSSLPVICGLAAATVVICDAIGVSLNPGYNPLKESISDLVFYPFGWLEQIGMAAAGLTQALFAGFILSSRSARINHWVRISGFIFAAMSIGFGVITLFKTDPGLGIESLGGGVHVTTVIAMAALFPVNCYLLSRAIGGNPDSATILHFSYVMAAIGGLIALQLLPLNPIRFIGISERLLAGVNLAWIVFAGSHLPHLVDTPLEPPARPAK
ncbi:hypothetical protein Dform_01396 [Dehalogenimonas formicexedens]|uniref:DUF998 domain-containing protein n=1 Tax=Dehalogenimonas formicexedens TaxID=1839801 RepID=A0A1P8F8F9_9CHLR|nr:DUF998 domain-containing protein [Dehalogenimonas formicexedens]APV44720.1 hypothetical protein Dform_01396 [Dehalogenimonas formicexedens]